MLLFYSSVVCYLFKKIWSIIFNYYFHSWAFFTYEWKYLKRYCLLFSWMEHDHGKDIAQPKQWGSRKGRPTSGSWRNRLGTTCSKQPPWSCLDQTHGRRRRASPACHRCATWLCSNKQRARATNHVVFGRTCGPGQAKNPPPCLVARCGVLECPCAVFIVSMFQFCELKGTTHPATHAPSHRKASGSGRPRCWAKKWTQRGAGREAFLCGGARVAGWVVPSIHRIETLKQWTQHRGPLTLHIVQRGTVADFNSKQIHKFIQQVF